MANLVYIYTDGCCKGNPGPGGWGAILIYNNNRKEIYGGEENTTNNRMELTAVIKALELIKTPNASILITTDSQYVKNGIETWIHNWKKNNWRTASKSAVKNNDLWKQLDELIHQYSVAWKWVKSHNGHPENERADQLANLGLPTFNTINEYIFPK